jgi:LmbE family N-acetylglucosaminyl deacetylase
MPAQRGAVLVVSPHSDDAVLSVGGLMQRGRARFSVLTVFGVSAWTSAGFAPDRQAEISDLRRREDVDACNSLGVVDFQSLELLEARSRGRDPFSPVEDADLGLLANLEQSLEKLIASSGAELVLFPLALGAHVDHLLLTSVAQRLVRRGWHGVAFYEDLPYAAFYSLDEIAIRVTEVADDMDATLERVQVSFDEATLKMKLHALRRYRSQLRPRDLRRVVIHAGRRERWGETIYLASGRNAGVAEGLARSIFK